VSKDFTRRSLIGLLPVPCRRNDAQLQPKHSLLRPHSVGRIQRPEVTLDSVPEAVMTNGENTRQLVGTSTPVIRALSTVTAPEHIPIVGSRSPSPGSDI